MDSRTVAISSIRVNPGLRGIYEDSDDFAGLCRSVKANGVLKPIEVREGKDAESGEVYFDLSDGGHRLEAAKRAGFTEIDVIVRELTDADIEQHQLELNLHNVDTNPIDYTKMLVKMLQRNPLMSAQGLGDYINASESFVNSRLGLLKLTEDIQTLVRDGSIPVTSAQELAKLPKEEQAEWVEDAIAQQPAEFVPAVKERLKEIRKAAREGKKAEPKTFTPTAKVRTKSELEARFAESKGKERDTLAWVLQLDDASIAQAKADYEAKESEKAEKSAKSKAEREAKKAKEAVQKAEAAQKEVAALLG
jgi:ParB family chromosome partitioning protein